MATKKKEESPETLGNMDGKPEEQTSPAPQAVETPSAGRTPTDNAPEAGTGTPPEPPETPEPEKEAPSLESLAVLADRHRVPTWQQAALARMMGWADGKKVSEADYTGALAVLRNRRIGGGRAE